MNRMFTLQDPVVQRVDSAVHWINHYPVDNSIGFANVYPRDKTSLNNKATFLALCSHCRLSESEPDFYLSWSGDTFTQRS